MDDAAWCAQQKATGKKTKRGDALSDSLEQLDIITGWDQAKCDTADGQWVDVLGFGTTQCIYSSDYKCVAVDDAGVGVTTMSSEAVGGCAIDGTCMDATTESVCDNWIGGGSAMLAIILSVVGIIALAIVLWCFCKKKED